MPSRSEVAPLSILEAFALKIPVIGSDIPAIRDMIIPNFNGILFESENVDSLSTILDEIIQNQQKIKQWSDNIGEVRKTKDIGEETELIYKKITFENISNC